MSSPSTLNLDDYQPGVALGSGVYGRVVSYEHLGTGHKVAVKKYNTPTEHNDDDNEDSNITVFVRELLALQSLQNIPHVVRLQGFDFSKRYLVMEQAQTTLATWLTQQPVCVGSKSIGVLIIQQLARGLRCLHERRLYHRDLKPDNVLVDEDCFGQPTVRIADFGLSRTAINTDDRREMCLSRPMYTLWYRAPELLVMDCDVRHTDTGNYNPAATDVYSLGMVWWDIRTFEPNVVHGGTTYNMIRRTTRVAKHLQHIRSHWRHWGRPVLEDRSDMIDIQLARMIHPDPMERATLEYILRGDNMIVSQPVPSTPPMSTELLNMYLYWFLYPNTVTDSLIYQYALRLRPMSMALRLLAIRMQVECVHTLTMARNDTHNSIINNDALCRKERLQALVYLAERYYPDRDCVVKTVPQHAIQYVVTHIPLLLPTDADIQRVLFDSSSGVIRMRNPTSDCCCCDDGRLVEYLLYQMYAITSVGRFPLDGFFNHQPYQGCKQRGM